MAHHPTGLSHPRFNHFPARACDVLFAIFCFVYLFVLQRDVISALYHVLVQGRSYYSPWVGAVILTAVLLLLCLGISKLLKLDGSVRALAYFPSCLLLGVLTDVDVGIFHGEYTGTKWLWLFPMLLLIYIGGVCMLRWVFRFWWKEKGNGWTLINVNLFILLLWCLITVCIGNTDVNFHHNLAMEQAIRDRDYVAARQVGIKSFETNHTLSVLRAYTLSLEGTMGEHLFEYPHPKGANDLLFTPRSRETLYTDADSLYAHLGDNPRVMEQPIAYLERLCREGTGRYTALDYYLCALLLDRNLPRFASAVEMYYFELDTLPRHYREALVLHREAIALAANDSTLVQRWENFKKLRQENAFSVEKRNRIRQEYGDTYWWYYFKEGSIH